MARNRTRATAAAERKRTLSRRKALAAGGVAAAGLGGAVSSAQAADAAPGKEVENLGVPWEEQYGYAQAVKVGDTIYLSGRLSHDEKGEMVGPAPLDAQGRIADHGTMGTQMARTYANIRTLPARYGATMDDLVEEVLCVTDMDAAFAAAGSVRSEAYGGRPAGSSTILVTPRLALPEQLIEIQVIAKV